MGRAQLLGSKPIISYLFLAKLSGSQVQKPSKRTCWEASGVGVRDERKKRERMRVRIIRMHYIYRNH